MDLALGFLGAASAEQTRAVAYGIRSAHGPRRPRTTPRTDLRDRGIVTGSMIAVTNAKREAVYPSGRCVSPSSSPY
jgi:hypothetical protein